MTKIEMDEDTGSRGRSGADGGKGPTTEANGKIAEGRRAEGVQNDEHRSVVGQIQEAGRDVASKSVSAISEKTRAKTAGYQSEISSGLHTLAEGLRQTSSQFQNTAEDTPLSSASARYIGDLAEKLESVSSYFERKDASALMQDVKAFAKSNPTLFVGGAFVVGFAVSRLVRSSSMNSLSRG